MFTLRCIPPDRLSDAPGLTLSEAFVRMMAVSGRAYRFTRTSHVMHLLMTDPPPGIPDFQSANGNDWAARMEIVEQVCAHGLGDFRVISDEEYRRELSRSVRAA